MPYKKLRIEIRNKVGYILLCSGQRFNKLSITTLREVKRAITELSHNPEAVCLVITGYPGESFAVGADISQMAEFGPADGFSFGELGQSLFEAMESCPKPVIGALNGITMGGGCDLALACDLRIASDALVIAHPGAKLGIITGFCGTQKLPRLVGRNFAREIFMTSEPYRAADALRMGLVDRVYPAGEFWERVVAFAERIANVSPAALAMAKKAINASEDCDMKTGCALEAASYAYLYATSTERGRMTEFLEGTTNVFGSEDT
ncbi:enoyl-CoA hydratase/isomerase family protein [Geobacter hydrogenophilus]|uniref:Crotonase n=1 Tax=Geobacter hydrogenophilus TaxID=40983 RepID=A0A9W6LDT7_9BACT|nr:enoyl-CoA hydratase/isomerase family protein [Geobacter hydrogenophilus]MBT0893330.1 enoyl-CoA hydratase/isomerase family protein [Geobacter hydrogenophilus]GLI38821.1 crotonase [Geobacter hydrogenophilus]